MYRTQVFCLPVVNGDILKWKVIPDQQLAVFILKLNQKPHCLCNSIKQKTKNKQKSFQQEWLVVTIFKNSD